MSIAELIDEVWTIDMAPYCSIEDDLNYLYTQHELKINLAFVLKSPKALDSQTSMLSL